MMLHEISVVIFFISFGSLSCTIFMFGAINPGSSIVSLPYHIPYCCLDSTPSPSCFFIGVGGPWALRVSFYG
ncbi:hypothetical protein BJY04DRAFT_93836 [Aspergillus karnatakaensis]|uniref:uncharacterized protein n=1 Tax=Aspergillus karnatakaensis TaxID=1810916 RepID=UPI003CCD550C